MKKLLFVFLGALLTTSVNAHWFNVVFYDEVYSTKMTDLSFGVTPERCQKLLIKYSKRPTGPYWISCSIKPLPNAMIIRSDFRGDYK